MGTRLNRGTANSVRYGAIHTGGWSVAGWHGRYDAVTDTISGDFTFVTQKHLSSCYFTNDLLVNATSMSLSHGALWWHQ